MVAQIAIEFPGNVVATLVVSHAPFLRKGLAPELELHGSDASLGVDRITGRITIARPGKDVELLETLAEEGLGNRFEKWVFPALSAQLAGDRAAAEGHPTLYDGWRVQEFTDAAVQSVERGAWAVP